MKKKILMGYNFKREGFETLEDKYEIIYPENNVFTLDEIIEKVTDVDVLVPSFTYHVDNKVIDAGKNLKLIANYGAGFNNIDTEYAAKKGVTVTNTPQSVLEPTAELCFGLIMATARRIGYYNYKLHEGARLDWTLYGELGMPLYGQTLGIYGMGRIGQAVARRAIASGMNIIYHNRKRLAEDIEKKYNARYVDFDTLLTDSDVISLNAPSTPETYHLMGAEEFKKMKKTAIIVNTVRGQLIDDDALIEALKTGSIYAAGLDVYPNEPKIPEGYFALDNVVLCPHAGTKTLAARIASAKEVSKNIINFFEGGEIDKVN